MSYRDGSFRRPGIGGVPECRPPRSWDEGAIRETLLGPRHVGWIVGSSQRWIAPRPMWKR